MKTKSGFWKRVDSLRSTMALTQKELAYKIGVSVNTFISWGARNAIPSGTHCYMLANTLGVTVEYLITGEEIPLPDDEYTTESDRLRTSDTGNAIAILASPRLSRIVSRLPEADGRQLDAVEVVLGINPERPAVGKDKQPSLA